MEDIKIYYREESELKINKKFWQTLIWLVENDKRGWNIFHFEYNCKTSTKNILRKAMELFAVYLTYRLGT